MTTEKRDQSVTVMMSASELSALDKWCAAQDGNPGRSDAIGQIVAKAMADAAKAAMADIALRITYKGANGKLSERTIMVKSIEPKGDHFRIRAFCLNRNALRMFQTDRIQECTVIDTDEIVDANEFARQLLSGNE